MILSTAALKAKGFMAFFNCISNQNMVLPFDTRGFWRQLNLLSFLILLINMQCFKVLKDRRWIDQKDLLPSKEMQLSQQKFMLCLLSAKVNNYINFWKTAEHKFFLTSITAPLKLFLYNGQKWKNLCKSPCNFKSCLVLSPGRSLEERKKKKKREQQELNVVQWH